MTLTVTFILNMAKLNFVAILAFVFLKHILSLFMNSFIDKQEASNKKSVLEAQVNKSLNSIPK